MIPTKIIVLIICICSFQSTDAVKSLTRIGSDLLNNLALNFKTIQNYFQPPPAVKEYDNIREVEIWEDIIDLNFYTPNTVEFYKNVVLLFCKIIDNKFFQSRAPVYELSRKLEDLGISGGREESDLIQELTDLTVDILHVYNSAIRVNGYTDMAYFYNALQWLNQYMAKSEKVSDLINEIIQFRKKARNYLFEFIPLRKIAVFIDIADDKFKRIDGWKQEDVYSVAITFIGNIWEVDKDAAHKVKMQYTELEVYELMFEHAMPHSFHETMHMDVWQAHVLINKRLDYESTINSEVKSPFKMGIATNDIDLETLPNGSIRYYKHVAILFIEAIEKRIQINVPENIREELKSYPEDQTIHRNLRYCTFQKWFSTVIQTIASEFSKNDFSTNLLKRSTILRLLDWFEIRMSEYNSNMRFCSDLFENVNKFKQTFVLTSLLSVKARDEQGLSYEKKYKSINRFAELSSIGELEDYATNTLAQISIASLSSTINSYEEEMKRLQQLVHPSTDALRSISSYKTYISKLTSQKNYIITRFGNPQKDSMLSESPSFYDKIIKMIDDYTLPSMTGMSISEMMESLALVFMSENQEWKTYHDEHFSPQKHDNA